MRSLSLLGLAATASAGSVSIPIARNKFNFDRYMTVTKRDGSFNIEALNNVTGGGYYAEFGVGTPPQQLVFHLDTGSSDTWVNEVDNDLCSSSSAQEELGFCHAQFDQTESDTFSLVDRAGFDITYLDGRSISGDYFNDTVTFGDVQVRNQQLGLATSSVRPSGLMGLGFKINTASNMASDGYEYDTILDNLVAQGQINTHLFSMYLNDLQVSSGVLLFGATDSAKYIGDLAILPIVPDQAHNNDTNHYNVRLGGFSVGVPDGESEIDVFISENANAILDSGSTLSIMPNTTTGPLYERFDVRVVPGIPNPFVDCRWADDGEGYTYSFEFDGKTIVVPQEEMILDPFTEEQQEAIMENAFLGDFFDGIDSLCMFGISPSSDFNIDDPNFVLLGDTFLRSAYVVYDQTHKQIGIAQSNLRSEDEDIHEVPTNGTIPRVKGVDRQVEFEDDDENGTIQLGPNFLVFIGALAAGFALL